METTLPEPTDASVRRRPIAGWIAIGDAAVLFVGTLLAWVEVEVLGTSTSISGLDTDDGKLVAGAAGLGLLLALIALLTGGARWLYALVPLGVLTAIAVAYDLVDVENAAGELGVGDESLIAIDAGIGLWVCAIGAVSMAFSGVWAFVERRIAARR